MAFITRCGKCECSTFEAKEIEPQHSAYKLIAVQCTRCGTPFGTTDYFNVGSLLKKQEKQLDDMEKKLKAMELAIHNGFQMVAANRR